MFPFERVVAFSNSLFNITQYYFRKDRKKKRNWEKNQQECFKNTNICTMTEMNKKKDFYLFGYFTKNSNFARNFIHFRIKLKNIHGII